MRRLILAIVAPVMLVVGSGARPAIAQEGAVYTVNYPLYYFASRIAAGDVEVVFPTPADEDPAFWTPGAAEVVAYQRADLILLNGAGYAQWAGKAALPRGRIVDTSRSFGNALVKQADAGAHTHGPEGPQAHGGGMAFTTWLDLDQARAQAKAAYEAMALRWPEFSDAFAERHGELDADLASLDGDLARAAEGLTRQPLIASHPVYEYLARRYGLDIVALHWEPDATPDGPQWREFAELLSRRPAAIMIWEDEPTPETHARLMSYGVETVVFRTLANRPANGDFLSGFNKNISRIDCSIRKAGAHCQ